MYSSTWSVCKSVRGGNLHRRHSLRPLRHPYRSNLKPKRQLCRERGRRWRRGPKSRKLTRDRRRPSLQLLLEAVLVPCSEVGGEESNLNCYFNISAPCWIFSDCMFVHRVYQILLFVSQGLSTRRRRARNHGMNTGILWALPSALFYVLGFVTRSTK